MLPRSSRLVDSIRIAEVKARGTRLSGKHLRLMVASRKDEGNSRFTFITSTAVVRSAVSRNKIKRRMRETTKKILPKLKPGADIVVIAQPSIISATQSEIDIDLRALLETRNLVNTQPEKRGKE